MPDTTPKFDPIPRLQQIAATIEESGAGIFDAPNTAVHYIKCAIKEIERLRKERDDARQEICIRACDTLGAVLSGSTRTPQDYAEEMGWDCFKENINA